MTSPTLWERAVRLQFGNDAVMQAQRRIGTTIEVTCSGGRCREPHRCVFSAGPRIPPSALASKLAAAGWRLGRRLTCPHCVEAEREQG